MLTRIDLRHLKCFEALKLPLRPLTLLSGANASGKSSVMQALVLLHQTMREHEWSSRLMLNGSAVRLGAVADVVDQVHGRRDCGIVTNSAVGEAAFRTLHGADCGLISVTPSDWDYSPLDVTWRREDEGADDRSTALQNWRSSPTLEAGLRDMAPPIRSWDDLRQAAARFESLTCTGDCFDPLSGVPFAKSAAGCAA